MGIYFWKSSEKWPRYNQTLSIRAEPLKMASRVKTRSSEVSGASPSCSKKGNGSSSGQPGTSQERDPSVDIVHKVLERVLDRLSAAMDEAIDRLVQCAITSMNVAFEVRIAALEEKFQCLPAAGQHERQPSYSGESNSTTCIQNQVLRLQHSLAHQEHEANFVLPGVPEKEVEEHPVHTVAEACKKPAPQNNTWVQKSGLRQPCEEIQGSRKGEKLWALGFLGGCMHFSSFTCLVFSTEFVRSLALF